MINDLIRDGWSYHDTESERLAGELEAAGLRELKGEAPAHCLRLANHTIGEHLGDWPRARRFAEAVREATSESVVSDWDFNPRTTRTIHVDTRYMLCVMEKIDGADWLIEEMTIVESKGGA